MNNDKSKITQQMQDIINSIQVDNMTYSKKMIRITTKSTVYREFEFELMLPDDVELRDECLDNISCEGIDYGSADGVAYGDVDETIEVV